MADFVEIINSDNIITFDLMKAVLRQNSIAFITRDELTVQTDPLYSNAIGGAKLLVHPNDVLKAVKVLEEAGYNVSNTNTLDNPIAKKLLPLVSGIPFLNKMRFELQIIIVMSTIAIVVALIFYLLLTEFSAQY